MAHENAYLRMIGITKYFHGVQALDDVDFYTELGKVSALVGENGAGKSTLIKILAGIHKRDAGEIFIGGRPVKLENPISAMQSGISIIHQELNVMDNLSIAENIFVGRERKKGLFVDRKYYYEKTKELLREVDLNVDPSTLTRYLSTAQKQLVEILRAVSCEAKVIVMDEPTSSLTLKETEVLFDIIRTLKKKGVGIIYISHRLEEVSVLADTVTVLRDGKLVGELSREEMSEDKIITMMVGRELNEMFAKKEAKIGEVVLEGKGLCVGYVQNVNFKLRSGEILGFSGLVGAGRSEVMRLIFGIDKKDAGEVFITGKKAEINCPADAIELGIALLPEDRKEQALILGMDVKGNITLPILKSLKKGLFYSSREEASIAQRYVDTLNIVTPSVNQIIKNLSGGNQQKVVLAKWLASNPKVLILDEPTRGIDVGAKKEIHELMSDLAQQGVAIIMVSSELPEILGMSDRIIVMHEGRIKGELLREQADQETIMQMAVAK